MELYRLNKFQTASFKVTSLFYEIIKIISFKIIESQWQVGWAWGGAEIPIPSPINRKYGCGIFTSIIMVESWKQDYEIIWTKYRETHKIWDFNGDFELLKFQVNLYGKMVMTDLQRYPWKLCLIKYELDINVFVSSSCLFSFAGSMHFTCALLACKNQRGNFQT